MAEALRRAGLVNDAGTPAKKAKPAPRPDRPSRLPGRTRLNGVMAEIADFERLIAGEHGLVVVSVTRGDGTISSSVVNAGVLKHPVTGETAVGMVIRGGTRKLAYLRERPYANVVVRTGWQWAAAEGRST